MEPRKSKSKPLDIPEFPPSLDPEQRENEMIMLAYARAEQDMRDGTAPSQVVLHFLNLGSSRSELEREKLESEISKLRAQVEQINVQKNNDQKFEKAIAALTRYGGRINE